MSFQNTVRLSFLFKTQIKVFEWKSFYPFTDSSYNQVHKEIIKLIHMN